MPNRAVHPRARSIFKARTKKPNFVLSVAATTIRLSFIIALCVGLALLGAVIGIAVGIGSVWLVEKVWPERPPSD